MAAVNGLGLKVCEEIYHGLKLRYVEECLKIEKISSQLTQIKGEGGQIRELQVEDLTFKEPEKMSSDEREQKLQYLMDVLAKIRGLEERAFELLDDLFLGAESLDGELKLCREQDRYTLENWGNELLDDEETVEKFIDELDHRKAFFFAGDSFSGC